MANATHGANVPAMQRTVLDLVHEYEDKSAYIPQAIADFDAAFERLGMAATVQGAFVAPVGSKSHLHEREMQKNLLASGWRAIYNRLNIDAVASAKDKQLFERTLAAPPPLTFDTAKATFRDYLERPRFHILKGLAEAFVDLDPAYKSHSKVRIGVKGLPKRIILTGWGEYNSGWAVDRFRDVANALAAYQGKAAIGWDEIRDIDRRGDTVMADRGMTVRRFQNGNAHIFFDKWTLFDINKALGEFYGEVLPDAEPEDVKPSTSTAVAKDLQFYWSPPAVVAAALDYAGIHEADRYSRQRPDYRVLEPSCGDGRILDEIRARGCNALGFEYHAPRAAEAKAKGHAVVTSNFLDQSPVAEFDRVVMNPPFYGRHYVQHVKHAYKFLKPGGVLVSILPATAHYDHGELKGEWRDLPVGSFADAGTNVPTGLLRMIRAA